MSQDKDVKIDRKKIKGPDAFVRKGSEWLKALAKQKTRVLPILLTVVAVVVAVYGYDAWSGRKLDKAWSAFYAASKQAEPMRWDALKKVATDWKGTRAGYFAAIQVGDHFFNEARKEALKGTTPPVDAKTPAATPGAAAASAVEWYGNALAFSDLTAAERPLVLMNRGEAYELQGKLDEALTDYQKAADAGGDSKALALLQVGRAYELKKDTAKAVQTYEQVSNEFRTTEFGRLGKNAIRRIKSPLFTAASGDGTKS